MIKTGTDSHTTPINTPNAVPLIALSNKCNFTLFFSISQKRSVKAMIANSGMSSAHNLHIAGFSEDNNGKTEDNIAHPRKKPINLIIVTAAFFKTDALRKYVFIVPIASQLIGVSACDTLSCQGFRGITETAKGGFTVSVRLPVNCVPSRTIKFFPA